MNWDLAKKIMSKDGLYEHQLIYDSINPYSDPRNKGKKTLMVSKDDLFAEYMEKDTEKRKVEKERKKGVKVIQLKLL